MRRKEGAEISKGGAAWIRSTDQLPEPSGPWSIKEELVRPCSEPLSRAALLLFYTGHHQPSWSSPITTTAQGIPMATCYRTGRGLPVALGSSSSSLHRIQQIRFWEILLSLLWGGRTNLYNQIKKENFTKRSMRNGEGRWWWTSLLTFPPCSPLENFFFFLLTGK